MIYHIYSFVGFMLWLRYALLRLRPFTSLHEIYSKYRKNPGTKAYTVAEAWASKVFRWATASLRTDGMPGSEQASHTSDLVCNTQ